MTAALRTTRLWAAWGWSFAALLGAQDPPNQQPGQEQGSSQSEPGTRRQGGGPWRQWTNGTGNWWGVRTDLEKMGIDLQGSYIFDWSRLWRGGIGSGTAYRSLLNVNATLDLERLFGLPRTEIYIDFQNQVGEDFSFREVGDIQVFDNLDSFNFTEIYDLWFQTWIHDWLRIKVGKMDANEDFGYLLEALGFMHSTPGNPPTMLAFPTYPEPTVGAVLFTYPARGWYAGAGIFDGDLQDSIPTGIPGRTNSGEYYLIGETGYRWPAEQRAGNGRVAVGGWYASGDFARFDGGTESGASGFYVLAEQKLWREMNGGVFDDQGLAVMASYGQADEEVSDFRRSIMGGVTYTGPIPGRDDDSVGAMVAYADLSDVPSAGFPEDETAFELYYRARITPFFTLQPVLSYIVHPSGQPNIDNALIGSLRGEFTF